MDNCLKEISQQFFETCPNLAIVQEPFPISNIAEQLRIRDLQNEFELIRSLTETKKHRMRLRSNTTLQIKKNRYPEQAIFQHSRVILSHTKEQGGYINANFIPFLEHENQGEYKIILTQGPTQNTIEDFNKMLEQQQIECVVMLCRLMENGKNRCADYIGDSEAHEHDKQCDYITTKTVKLGSQFGNHQYQHVYYSEWPDKKVPSQLSHISELIKTIQKFKRIVVHCSAGLGRSGVIAALLLIVRSSRLRQEKKLSIFETVRRMREYRFGAVQNSEQYAFLYSFFNDYDEASL